MENNTPYKAKAMKPINPMSESACKGEYCQTSVMQNTRPMKRPSKASVGGALVDGPFGGKKPA